ncbi:hypothetical protein E2562_009697 [Oryza meyeriana var. granulata]|uniref:Uncharacterized protein n=1 Tax=Oryza meyeriana var. granulata TaxID=110450 RepID=A0A6G1D0D0_9ORYZ|nr:hypothetical protein E2562_009697 [Oryza meyeriana var. granulata]
MRPTIHPASPWSLPSPHAPTPPNSHSPGHGAATGLAVLLACFQVKPSPRRPITASAVATTTSRRLGARRLALAAVR